MVDAAPDEFDDLIRRAREGCQDSLGKLIQACRNYLLQIANDELPSDLRAKIAPSDLVQDTCVEAQQNFAAFRGTRREELLVWLRRILLFKVSNASRHYDTDKRQLSREVPLDDRDSSRDLRLNLAALEPSPSEVALANEDWELLNAAIGRLPEHFRAAILLRHRDGLSFADIAQRLNRSPGAVRKLWERGLGRLADELRLPNDNE